MRAQALPLTLMELTSYWHRDPFAGEHFGLNGDLLNELRKRVAAARRDAYTAAHVVGHGETWQSVQIG